MHHTKTYRSTRQRWNRISDTMDDANLIRAFIGASQALDLVCSPTNQAKFDALEAEMDHRDCYA